jgi:hypothetical protein
LFAASSPRTSLVASSNHIRRPSTATSVAAQQVLSSSPQMVRKPLGSSSSSSSSSSLSKVASSPVVSMGELRRVPEGVAAQLRPLLGRLVVLTKTYESYESAQLSVLELAGVMRCAFDCLDRGFCLDTLRFLLAHLDAAGWSEWTCSFLAIVFGPGSNFIALNLPRSEYGFTNVADYQKNAEINHPLIALIVTKLKQEVAEERAASSSSCIWLVVALLAQHDDDPLLKAPQKEEDEDEEDDEDDDDKVF